MKRNHHADPAQALGTLADDAKALLAATAEVAEDKVIAARERLAAALEQGREAWETVQDRAVAGAGAGSKAGRSRILDGRTRSDRGNQCRIAGRWNRRD